LNHAIVDEFGRRARRLIVDPDSPNPTKATLPLTIGGKPGIQKALHIDESLTEIK
jgi:hypothetical protein